MLRIRLRRMGAKHRPYYRLVVSESTRTPRARVNEVLGTYNPGTKPSTVRVNLERVDHWVGCGAHPSLTVARLIERARRAQVGA